MKPDTKKYKIALKNTASAEVQKHNGKAVDPSNPGLCLVDLTDAAWEQYCKAREAVREWSGNGAEELTLEAAMLAAGLVPATNTLTHCTLRAVQKWRREPVVITEFKPTEPRELCVFVLNSPQLLFSCIVPPDVQETLSRMLVYDNRLQLGEVLAIVDRKMDRMQDFPKGIRRAQQVAISYTVDPRKR